MTLFSDRDERFGENLRILNAKFARRPKKLPVRGERPAFALGGSAPTLVIAASNSPASTMAKADYICSGTDDNLLFQLAIQRMNDGENGRLLVCEGDYYFSREIVILENLRIEGMGMDSSRIHMASGSNANMFHLPSPFSATFELDSITLDGQKALQSSGSPTGILFDPNAGTGVLTMHKVRVHDFRGNGITLDRPACRFRMTSCQVDNNTLVGVYLFVEGHFMISSTVIEENGTIGIQANGAALELVGSVIRGNGTHGFSAGGVLESTQKLLIGNEFAENGGTGILWDGVNGSVVGNFVFDNGEYGMYLFGNEPLIATGNDITGNTLSGVLLEGGAGNQGGVFAKNVVKANLQHGVILGGAHWAVNGNRFHRNGLQTTNTYDDIFTNTNADDCEILNNKIHAAASGNVTRYGIHVVSGATNNWVAGNRPFGTFGTGAYNLVDASTVNVWAGSNGDNW